MHLTDLKMRKKQEYWIIETHNHVGRVEWNPEDEIQQWQELNGQPGGAQFWGRRRARRGLSVQEPRLWLVTGRMRPRGQPQRAPGHLWPLPGRLRPRWVRWPFSLSPPTALSSRDPSGGSEWGLGHMRCSGFLSSPALLPEGGTQVLKQWHVALSLQLTKPPGTYMSDSTGEHLKESRVRTRNDFKHAEVYTLCGF